MRSGDRFSIPYLILINSRVGLMKPIIASGISKAMMEKMMILKARMYGNSGTIFCGTRYGNVMASRGSVILEFLPVLTQTI